MDIKSEIDIKDDVLENIDSQHFGQDSELEETQEKAIDQLTDVKDEMKIKEEPLDIKEEYSENGQLIVLMKEKFCPNTDFEEEIEIKNEPLDINEEYTEHVDQNENQTPISDVDREEKTDRPKGKSPLRSKPQSSRRNDQRIKNKDSKSSCNLETKDEFLPLKSQSKKKFKCDQCTFECNLKSNLEVHLLIHSNTKLWKCSECSYECNRKGNL
ncbi:UNVERIFIED_CONTAM: hypothetical protein RMT77_014809 [Armadillidium vulgare]